MSDFKVAPKITLTDSRGTKHELGEMSGAVKVGKLSSCDLRLRDDTVARMHALLNWENEAWFCNDLGSTVGTRINGKRCAKQMLRTGDIIMFGTTAQFTVEIEDIGVHKTRMDQLKEKVGLGNIPDGSNAGRGIKTALGAVVNTYGGNDPEERTLREGMSDEDIATILAGFSTDGTLAELADRIEELGKTKMKGIPSERAAKLYAGLLRRAVENGTELPKEAPDWAEKAVIIAELGAVLVMDFMNTNSRVALALEKVTEQLAKNNE